MSRPVIALAGLVALVSSVSFAAEEMLAWGSPYSGEPPARAAGGGGDHGSGPGWNGPRPGWDDPLRSVISATPERGADWTASEPRRARRDAGPVFPDGQGEPYTQGLPAQAPPGWFDQFPSGTYRPVERAPRTSDDTPGFRFRPGEDGAGDAPPGPPRFEDFGYSEPPASAYPNYRFRGDPAHQRGGWRSQSDQSLYRFRPLNDQELGRMDQGSGWRPAERGRDRRPSTPPRDDWRPGEAFGFEPGGFGPR